MVKKCERCKQNLPPAAFNRDASRADGLRYVCRECQSEERQQYWQRVQCGRPYSERKERSERYKRSHRVQDLASHAVRNAVMRNKMEQANACERCGAIGVLHGHHADYSKPLEVEWLCSLCHHREHREVCHAM